MNPLQPIPTTNLDAGTDSPLSAQADLLEVVQRMNGVGLVPCSQYGTLNQAVTAIGLLKRTLVYGADITVSANIVIPDNIELLPLNDAVVNHSTYTVSYAGNTAGWNKAKKFNGTGVVSFAENSTIVLGWLGTDTASLQKTLDSASSAKATITGEGTFETTGALYFDSDIKVIAPGLTIKPTSSLGAAFALCAKHADATAYNGTHDVLFDGFAVDLVNAPLGGGIGAAHAKNLIFKGLTIKNTSDVFHHIDLPAVDNVLITGCTIIGSDVATAIQIDGAETGSIPGTLETLNADGTRSRDIRICNNYFKEIMNSAIHLHKNGHARIVITGNQFYHCQNSIIDDTGYSGTPANYYVVITNNTIRNNDAPAGFLPGNGIILQSGTVDFVVSNNSINADGYGIAVLENTGLGRLSNGTISGNVIRSTNKSGIIVQSSGGVIVTSNEILSHAAGYSAIAVAGVKEVNVSNNLTVGVGAGATSGTAGIFVDQIQNAIIAGNQVKGSYKGIVVIAQDDIVPDLINVFNNVVGSALSNGIDITAVGSEQVNSLVVCGNQINGASVAGHAIYIEKVRRFSIASNVCTSIPASKTGIFLNDGGQGTVIGNTLQGVSVSSNYGIQLLTVGQSAVTGNMFGALATAFSETSSAGYSSVTGNVTSGCTTDFVLGTGSTQSNNVNL